MLRVAKVTVSCLAIVLALPSIALAGDGGVAASPPFSWLHVIVSLVGLVVAVLLLLEALRLRKVGLGGAIAEKISYVILATVCLAASALAQWTANFLVDITLAQTQLASEVLVVVAMALLAVYFYSVRSAMQAYLDAMTGTEQLVDEISQPNDADPKRPEDADRG
jgi:uncharacterized membrane protein